MVLLVMEQPVQAEMSYQQERELLPLDMLPLTPPLLSFSLETQIQMRIGQNRGKYLVV